VKCARQTKLRCSFSHLLVKIFLRRTVVADTESAAFGIFANRSNAEAAVDQLTLAGFSNQDISALLSDKVESQEFASENQTKAAQAATAGAGVGGIVGGALGLLAGVGALAIPGAGPVIVAGPLMASLAGLGVGGAVGGLVGALVGMGIPEFEAKCYDSRVKDGAILLAVHCASSEEVCRARELLEAGGAEDIASCAGEYRDPEHLAASDLSHT
jgi:hypothetical protein